MSVRFVLGRAGSGKTELVLRELSEALERDTTTQRLVLLVPEQATFQMQRALVARSRRRGFWRAEVLSFSRLAHRVFAELGCEPPFISPHARQLALHALLTSEPGLARPFGAAGRDPAFIRRLDEAVAEFLRAGLEPQALREKAARLDDRHEAGRLTALAAVYEAFCRRLDGRLDPQQQLEVLRAQFSRLSWLADSRWWIDGFAGFTEQELATLVELATRAREVVITLLVDPQAAARIERPGSAVDALNLFARTLGTYRRLLELLRGAGVTIDPATRLSPAAPRFGHPQLAALEAGLVAGVETEPPAEAAATARASAVRLVRCATHRDELRAAARWIRRRIHESGGRLRFRDFAVVFRDLEPLAERVEEVFGEYGIPCFLDRRRPIRAHAVSRLLDATLELLASDFAVPAARRWLATGLLPLKVHEAERLETLLSRGPIEGRHRWQQPAWGVADLPAVTRMPARLIDRLEARRRTLVDALDPLLSLPAASDHPPTGRRWAEAIYAVLRGLGVDRRIGGWIRRAQRDDDRLTAEIHRLSWQAVCEILDDLHDVAGDVPLTLEALRSLVAGALEARTVALAPPTLDQVLVGSIERTRHPDVRCVWVCAFNDGIFPQPMRDDPLIPARTRERLARLGLHGLRNPRQEVFDEKLLAYIALTRASDALVISYATVSDQSDPLLPSRVLADVRRALPELIVETPDPHAEPVCLHELARGRLARDIPAVGPQPDDGSRWRALCRRIAESDAKLADRLAWLLRGRDLPRAGEKIVLRGADVPPTVSPSRINAILRCPFQDFAHRRLRLECYEGPPPAATVLGRIGHATLAAVTRQAMAAGEPVERIAESQWRAWFDEALREAVAAEAPLLGERQRGQLLLASLERSLWDALKAQIDRWKAGAFVPVGVELPLKPTPSTGELKAPRIGLDDDSSGASPEPGREPRPAVALTGFIDRLDEARIDGRRWVLVCDYKPTTQNVQRSYLIGYPLQIFAYLWAVLETGDPKARPAGVLIVPLWPDSRALNRKDFATCDAATRRLMLYRPHGLLAEPAAKALEPGLTPGHSTMYRIQQTKDGKFSANSPVLEVEGIRAYMELARNTIQQAVGALVSGEATVSPLAERKTLACQRCAFRTVCRFERDPRAIRRADAVLPTLSHPG